MITAFLQQGAQSTSPVAVCIEDELVQETRENRSDDAPFNFTAESRSGRQPASISQGAGLFTGSTGRPLRSAPNLHRIGRAEGAQCFLEYARGPCGGTRGQRSGIADRASGTGQESVVIVLRRTPGWDFSRDNLERLAVAFGIPIHKLLLPRKS